MKNLILIIAIAAGIACAENPPAYTKVKCEATEKLVSNIKDTYAKNTKACNALISAGKADAEARGKVAITELSDEQLNKLVACSDKMNAEQQQLIMFTKYMFECIDNGFI
jgi:hypothetical protein